MEEIFANHFREALDVEQKEINRNDRFRDYEEWSSLSNLALIAVIDEEYGVVIPPDDFKKIETVGELYDEVQKRKA